MSSIFLARAGAALGGAAVAFLAVGCGASADPKEVADVASRYTSSANPAALDLHDWQAKCRAKVFLESELSKSALKSVRSGHEPRITTRHDAQVMRELADKLADECVNRDD